MNKKIKLFALCMLAVMTTAFFAVPNTANAFEDPKKPVATDVHYYPNDTAPVKDRTGIKSFSLNPYTYYNLSKDTSINPSKKDTIKLDDATIKRIVKNQIFPKWSVIADGIFRDQADQLVTIKGTGMMSSSTSSSNSFDRHFNTGKSGVSGYNEDWAIGDLAYELRQEGTYTKGDVLKDEQRREGISTIGSLSDARRMMGQSLRNCSDDNDNTVDDFLGNSKQKTESAYRLPALDDDKSGSGYCNVVTAINQGAVNDYDYVTFGLAVYDFDVTPVAAKNLKFIEDAQKIDGGKDILMGKAGNYDDQRFGVHFNSSSREGSKSHFKNATASENTQSAGLETSTTEENTISQDETYEFGMEQEIGMEWNFGGWGDGDCMFPRLTVNMSNSWHELWSTTKSQSQTKSVTKTKNINTELTLPPDTVATVVQNIDNKNVEEDYQQPVVLNYKVAIFAMSGDFYNGTCGGIEPSRYDKQWMSVIFDGSDDKAVSGCDALGGLYRSVTDGTNRYDSAKGKLKSWCDKGAFTKSESINWTNIANSIAGDGRGTRNIVSSKTGKKATLEQMASELPLLEKAQTLESKQMTSTASVDQIMPLYPLKSVSLKSAQKNYSITPEEKFYLDNLEMEGTDTKSAEYYNFNTDWGQWYLLDENNNIIEDDSDKDESGEEGIVQFNALRLHTDELTDSQWIDTVGNQSSPAQHVKWVLDDEKKSEIVYNDRPGGMTSEELKNVSTPALSIQVVNQKDDIDRLVVTGDYKEPYDEPANLNSVFKAKAVDGDGKKKDVQILWEGDGDDGYEVEESGKIKFDKPGTYNVRAYCVVDNSEGRPVKKTSDWIEIKAVEKAKLDRMELELPADLDEDDTTITKKNQQLGFDLGSYVDLYDQYGEKWEGAKPEIKFDVTDKNGNEVLGANIDHNNVLTIYQKGKYKVTARAVDPDGEDLGIGNPSVIISVNEEDWLDQIIFKEPALSKDELSLKSVDDEVRIDGLSNQLVYIDQNGDVWEGSKKPHVEFYLDSETSSARVTGDSFFASEPGTYSIGALAANYEIDPVTVTIGEKSDNFIKTVDPDELIIDEIDSDGQFETIEYDLMRSVDYTTQRGSKWNDKYPKPAMKFTLEGEHKGASIEDGSIFKVNEPGTYIVHVEPKKASEYTASIDDIEINVTKDRKIKYVAVDFRALLSADRRIEGSSYILSDLAKYVKYYDQFLDEFTKSDLEKYKHEMPVIRGFGLKYVEGPDGSDEQAENQQHGTITSEYDYSGSRTIYSLKTDTPGEYEVAPVYSKGTAGADLTFLYGSVNILGENEEDTTEGKIIEKIGSLKDYSGDDQENKYFGAYVALGELYDYADPDEYSDESAGDELSDREIVIRTINDAADEITRILKDESIDFKSADEQFKSIVSKAKSEIDGCKTIAQRAEDHAKAEHFTTWVNALDPTEPEFTADVIKARELYDDLTDDQKGMVSKQTIAKFERAENSVIDAITLANAKKTAKNELDEIDVSAYSGDEKTIAEYVISEGKTLIDDAEKISLVEMDLQYTKAIIAELKTDKQKAADKEAYDMSKAKEVMRKIDTIPEDPGTDEDGIVSDVRAAYDALTQSQKDYVDAAYYNRLMAAEESVQVVLFTKDLIESIPEKLTCSENDQAVVLAANIFYDLLTDSQKSHFSEVELTKMQDAIAAMDVITSICDLKSPEELTDKDKSVVESARAAYNALTDDQKGMISEVVLERLKMAEAAIDLLDLQVSADVRGKIKEMMRLIDQIPDELTANDQRTITYARSYYATNIASLPEAVTFLSGAGYKKLTDSEAAIGPVVKIDSLSGKLPSGGQALENAIGEAQGGFENLTAVQQQRVDDGLVEKLQNYAAAKSVVEEIKALPDEVGAGDAQAVNDASEKYEALRKDQQDLIDPEFVKTLKNKEATVANAISAANQAAAVAVIEKIEAIPEISADPDEAAMNAFRSKVNEARTAYDALTDDQKVLVTNYSDLELAEARLEGNGRLDAINTAVFSDPEKSDAEEVIAAAKESLNTYSSSKENADLLVGIVENYVSGLKTDAQKEQDQVDYVIKCINEIPAKVTLDDEPRIAEARAAYDELTGAQKAKVGGKLLKKLEDAEKTIKDKITALRNAITAAENKLNSIDPGKYDNNDAANIRKIINDAKADMDKAKEAAEVDGILKKALSSIARYKTTAEKKAQGRTGQRGKDGTFFGKGASLEGMNNNITRYANNTDPKGTVYGVLQVKSTKQTANSIGLKWKRAKNTAKYVVYGAKSGKNKFVQITQTKGAAYNVKKVNTGLKKKTYYKFMVVAVDKNNNVISSSKIVHVATKGSKKCANCKKLKVRSKVNKKGKVTKKYKAVSAIKLRAGSGNKKLKKTARLKVIEKAPKKSKIRKYMKPRFESSNQSIVKVSKTGAIKAVKKGKAVVYVFAQNGMSKVIKVKVVK